MDLYFLINPLKSFLDFSDQTCSLLNIKYDSYGWKTLKYNWITNKPILVSLVFLTLLIADNKPKR